MLKDADVFFCFCFFHGNKKWGMLPGFEWTDAPKDSTGENYQMKMPHVSLKCHILLDFYISRFFCILFKNIFSGTF